MKTKIRIDLPSAAELIARLDLHDVCPQLGRAEEMAEAAEAVLDEARRQLAAATQVAEGMPAKVRAGQARPMDLEPALAAQRVAALAVSDADSAVAEAREETTAARADAVEALQAEVDRRGERLQAAADKLEPVLEQLRTLETALSVAAGSAVAGELDGIGRPVALRLPAVVWPASHDDERARHVIAHQRALADTGLTPAEYAREFGVGGHSGKRETSEVA